MTLSLILEILPKATENKELMALGQIYFFSEKVFKEYLLVTFVWGQWIILNFPWYC